MQLNDYVPDPDTPPDPSRRPSFLRSTSRMLREFASGVVSKTADKEKIKRYKELLFSAAKQLDEADKLIPEEELISPTWVTPWWVWLLVGGMTTMLLFSTWVAYMRFIEGIRIGFITE
jgi:hypothetical protein